MQERQYQVILNDEVAGEVSSKRKVLMQLPTGGGKTVCFAKLTQRFIRSTEKSVLIMVHREELMYQAARTIEELIGIKPHLITSKTSQFRYSKVYIGMVESTMSRLNLFSGVGLVIIDECHIANFNKVHHVFLEELIIGVTATPISSSKKEPLNKFYNAIVCGPHIKELIAGNYLAQNITRCPKDVVDSTQFEIDKMKGDYNERQMANEYKLPKHIINVSHVYFKYCLGKKTLIFNVSIEHSIEVTECLVAMGHNARHLASNNNEEREATLKWYRETENAILCNVMFFTFGFDEPTVQNVILNFSTLSLPKFIQCSGRGSRPIDDIWIERNQHRYPYSIEPKSHFNIIDMGGNCVRFGDWNDERDWEYMFTHPDRPGEGIAPVKTCPQCEGLLHAAKRVCDIPDEKGLLCLYEFQKKITAHEQDIEDLILMTKGIDIDELIGKHKKKYMYYTFLEMADPVVAEMFKKHGKDFSEKTTRKFFKAYYELCIDWWSKTYAGKDGNMDDIRDSGWHTTRAHSNFNQIISKYNEKYDMNVCALESVKDDTKEEDYLFRESMLHHPAMYNYVEEFKSGISIEPGDTVEHPNLGFGKVINIKGSLDNSIAVIKFENYEEEKQIITKYAKMRIASQA